MRLAIASPNRDAYSETFINMQMAYLPCALRIFGRPIASVTEPGGEVQPWSVRGFVDFAWHGVRHGFNLDGIRHGFSLAGSQAQELKRRLRNRGIEVLLANYGPAAVALQPICEELSIPMVVHFHGYDAHAKSVVEAHREAYMELGRKAARVVVVSHVMAESLEELGIPRHKMRLVRYGVDSSLFRPKSYFPAQPQFLGVGRFVDKKGPHLTLLAFEKVYRRLPESRLMLIGEGTLLESTRNLAAALGLEEATTFPGALSHEVVAKRMNEATAFVQHSLTPVVGPSAGDREGTPVVVLEAMMAGLPVISTRHAGIEEVIEHGRSGYLVAERDVKGMSEAMMLLATSPITAKSLGSAARTEALEKYSAESYRDSLQQILEDAVEPRQPEVRSEESFELAMDQG